MKQIKIEWYGGSKQTFAQVKEKPKTARLLDAIRAQSDGTGYVKSEDMFKMMLDAGFPDDVKKRWDNYIGGSDCEKSALQHCQNFIQWQVNSKGVVLQ